MLLDRKNPIHLREIIIAGVVVLTALILGSIFDFKIGESIFALGTPNAFAVTMSALSGLPTLIATGVGGVCLIAGRPHNCKKVWTVLSIVFGAIGIVAAAYFAFDTFKHVWQFDHLSYFNPKSSDFSNPLILIIAILFTLLLLGGLFCVYKFLTPKFDKRTMLIVGIYLLAIALLVAGFATVGKYLWSRPRPKYVFAQADPASVFHSVWQLDPLAVFKAEVKDNFKSFPSGHSVYSATAMFVLPMVTLLSDKTKGDRKLQISLFYAGFLWCLINALSRMMANAHFLSDVAGGALLTLIIGFVLTTVLFNLKQKKENAKA